MKKCTVYYSRADSYSRMLTGFYLLRDRLDLQLKENTDNLRKIPGKIAEVEIDGKILAFDMGDRWELCSEAGIKYLDRVDFYFARDYSDKKDIVTPYLFTDNEKVKPFGFNYYSTYPTNPMDKSLEIKHNITDSIKRLSGYKKCFYYDYYEKEPDYKDEMSIIFMARLWNPDTLTIPENASKATVEYLEYMREEWNRINKMRIAIIRRLRKEYAGAFFGGVFDDEYSEKVCDDIVLDRRDVRKKSYLDRMKSSDICIGTMGLHRSIGWKMGEYVAASRAIVAEKMEYCVTGNFEEGRNYLPFTTEEECAEAVAALYSSPEKVYEMKKENYEYYCNYLRPDRQILNALEAAGIEL